MDNQYRHYFLAHLIPLFLYMTFFFIGWELLDFSSILVSSISVKDGLLPYKDFHFIVAPLTLYTQAGLQKIFNFLSPIVISRLWKGLIYLFLSFISLIYLANFLKKLGIRDQLSLKFIYIYPIIFMLVITIHEIGAGYTTDALLFSSLGILLLTWPHAAFKKTIKAYALDWLGFLFLGLSFGYKQEIGIMAVFCGLLYLIIRTAAFNVSKINLSLILDIFIPSFLLLLAPLAMFIYFYSHASLNAMINSIFVIPWTVKATPWRVFSSLLTFGTGFDETLIASYIFFILVLLLLYMADNGSIHRMLNFYSSGNTKKFFKFFKIMIILGVMAAISFLLMTKNFQSNAFFYQYINIVLERFFKLYRLFYLLALFATLALFIFSIIKLKGRLNLKWLLNYIVPISLLILIFDSAAAAGTSVIRLNRIITPLFLCISMISLVYIKGPFKIFNLTWRKIYIFILAIILIFLSARLTGVFSGVLSDPIHNKLSYSKELNYFIDKDIYANLEDIKEIVDRDKKSNIFVYQTDDIFYIFLDKKPVSFSYAHYIDWFPPFLENKEINRLKSSNITFIITQLPPTKEAGILFRNNDPIRDFIEDNYAVILKGKYFYLWKIKDNRK